MTATTKPECKPVKRAKRDPQLAARVDAAWARLEAWLEVHAPKTYRALGGAAKPYKIRRLEQAAGPLPADLRASLLRHDGARWGSLLFGPLYGPSSADSILDNWRFLCDLGGVLPFADAGDGGYLIMDARGRGGEYYNETGSSFRDGWPSYAALLEELADALESGTPPRGERHSVTPGGELTWPAE